MKRRSWGIAALAACLALATATRIHAYEDAVARGADDLGGQMEQAELESYNSCNTCPTACGGMGAAFMDRPIQLVAGAEYIYAQATFSEALAFAETVPGVGTTFHQIDFDYDSSFAAYGGVYLPDCGGSLIFEYTQLNSSGDFAAAQSGTTQISAPFEINGNIQGFADVELDSFDVSFGKTIPLGCLQTCATGCADGCECADSCASGCGCGWCPAWDVTWSGGVRFANVDWISGAAAFDPLNNNAFVDSAFTTLDFEGFGGRVGLLGRRYLGRRGLFSLYAKGDWSVLFGEVNIETIERSAPAGAAINFFRTTNDITVPVTEIELGSSAHLGANATLSAGYFWSAWHDLGMSHTAANTFGLTHYDDANILGWNGFFARAEVAF